ncbi:hypothetical protein UAY_03241 [Enterococcus moraviensis ATCC BAA-383]|uniref:Uncharacterized protein n=1 Tax=Enterococcus moraviensis ATCC BAA-383 TaxID=1158609 RepID=R2SKW4_9ENTE|nr:hypothetical protein [Enterococcus moraviensis]EOH95815.1 hypothetical protein UAY_03241 [Enterococcus moraviensis ATCC BAA-383]EOT66302.1 hypothetical protein I586_02573 [Enterococcus moraviensis ATCC BAA-383]OJG67634.1 hypothetical protein RV09_GL002403 [Enterococcus moraviensis]
MTIEQVTVTTKVELEAELDKKTDEIIVEGDFSQNIAEIKKGQLEDTDMLGFAVGSLGAGILFEYGINKLLDVFDPATKEDKKIRKQIERLYRIKRLTKDSFLLRLKQLDY